MDLSGGSDLFLPLDAGPGGGEVAAAWIDEALEAQVGSGEGDEEESPEEHGVCRSEAMVELTVWPVDFEFSRRWRKQFIFYRKHG